MTTIINYDVWVKNIWDKSGGTVTEARRIADAAAPGARERWKAASRGERRGAVVPAIPESAAASVSIAGISPETVRRIREVEAIKASAGGSLPCVSPGTVESIRSTEDSKASGGAGSQGFEPITDETKRIALGYSKRAWAERNERVAAAIASFTSEEAQPDYFALVADVRRRRNCGFVEAAREVNRTNPKSWAAMLSKANGGRDFSDRITNR